MHRCPVARLLSANKTGILWAADVTAALISMNTEHPDPEDVKLGSLLRESRAETSLPPRFQENVWRRIEEVAMESSAGASTRLDALVAWLLRPRLAFIGIAVLILVGAFLGMREGTHTAQQDARSQYLTAVAPNSLR